MAVLLKKTWVVKVTLVGGADEDLEIRSTSAKGAKAIALGIPTVAFVHFATELREKGNQR